MPTPQHRQESLCRAYVQAVAAQAGVNFSALAYDYGVDITLRSIDEVGPSLFDLGVPLDLQLKSTTRVRLDADHVRYDLKARTYQQLRLFHAERPGILVLLVLPNKESEWLFQSEEELVLRRCAYWISFRGAPLSKAKRSVRVRIPRENIFDVSGLRAIFTRLRNGEGL